MFVGCGGGLSVIWRANVRHDGHAVIGHFVACAAGWCLAGRDGEVEGIDVHPVVGDWLVGFDDDVVALADADFEDVGCVGVDGHEVDAHDGAGRVVSVGSMRRRLCDGTRMMWLSTLNAKEESSAVQTSWRRCFFPGTKVTCARVPVQGIDGSEMLEL